MAVALREGGEEGNTPCARFRAADPGVTGWASWVKTTRAPAPRSQPRGEGTEGKRALETEAGRQGPGERRLSGRGRPGAAPAKSPRVASRCPRRPGVAPRPRAREGSTHPACVVAAAGARVPGVRHAALCASALRLPPPRRGRPGPHHRSPRGGRASGPPALLGSTSGPSPLPALRPVFGVLCTQALTNRRSGK